MLKSAKCLRREKKTYTNRTSVYVIHKTSLRRWCVAKRSVKKSFSIRGINAQTDTGLCVRNIYVIRVCVCTVLLSVSVRRVRTREHTSIRLPVLTYNRETVFPTTAKTLSLILACSRALFLYTYIYIIYYYTYIYSRRRRIHVFRHCKLARAHTRAYVLYAGLTCVFSRHKVLIGLDIVKIPRKSLLGFWTWGI